MHISTTTVESNTKISQKAKDRTALWSSDTTPGIYTKGMYDRDTCTPMFIAALFIIANNDIWFEGKWIKVEDFMLCEVSQVMKHKSHMFSLIYRR
jgi:hypothetical protein